MMIHVHSRNPGRAGSASAAKGTGRSGSQPPVSDRVSSGSPPPPRAHARIGPNMM